MPISIYFPCFCILASLLTLTQQRAPVSCLPQRRDLRSSDRIVGLGWEWWLPRCWELVPWLRDLAAFQIFSRFFYFTYLSIPLQSHFQKHLALPHFFAVKLRESTGFLFAGSGSAFSGPLSSLHHSFTCLPASRLFACFFVCPALPSSLPLLPVLPKNISYCHV